MISIVWLYDVVISDEECTCGGSGAQNINCKAHVPTSDCSSIGLYIVCLKSLNFEDYRAIYVTICKYLFRKNSRQKETKVLEDSCCLEWAETCLTGLDGTRTLHSLSSKDKQMSHVNHLRGKGAFEILSLKNSCTFLSSKDILFSEGYRRYLALCLGSSVKSVRPLVSQLVSVFLSFKTHIRQRLCPAWANTTLVVLVILIL